LLARISHQFLASGFESAKNDERVLFLNNLERERRKWACG